MRRHLPGAIGVLVAAVAIVVFHITPRSPPAAARSDTAASTDAPTVILPTPDLGPKTTLGKSSTPAIDSPALTQDAARTPATPVGLRARIIDEVSTPIPEASIWVIRAQAYDFPPKREIDSVELCEELAEVRGVSDAAGMFEWPELTPGHRVIVARKSGHHVGSTWCEQAGETAPIVDVKLRRGGGLRGIVFDHNDTTPAVGAFVTTMPRPRPGLEREPLENFWRFLVGGATHTGPDGRFELESLTGNTSELYCTLPGRPQICVDWYVPDGQELSLRFVDSVAVSGSVSDESGAPIEGANIYISTPGVLPLQSSEVAHSDEHGEFRVDAIPPGPIEIKVDKRGFGIFKQPYFVKDGGEAFDISLKPEVEFMGNVVDIKGKPIEGAMVRVVDATQFVMCGQMETLADGSWFMYWVPEEGQIDVYVSKNEFMPTSLRGLKAPQKDLRIELKPRSNFDGRVVDPEGKPVTSFAFHSAVRGLSQAYEYSSRVEGAWYPANSLDGHFGYGGNLCGLLEVSVRAAGFRPKTISDILLAPGASVGPVEFRLERSRVVEGTLVDMKQKPVVGGRIDIADSTFDGRPAITREPFGVPSGPDGRFLLDTVPDGPFTIVVRRGENQTVFADLRSDDFPRVFVLEAEGEIVGSVNGSWTRPETCVRVRVSLDRTWVGRETRPDADGRFRVSNLAPGDYRIDLIDDWAEYERLRNGRVSSFATVRSGETTMVVLDATGSGVIEGRILTQGAKLTGDQVTIRAFAGATDGPPIGESSVDSNGLFRFDHLHAGTYRIRVGSYERGTSLAVEREVAVQDNATVGPIEFVLGSGGLTGRVLRDDSSPADAQVALVSQFTGSEVAAVRTDSDGTYRFLSAPDGNYYVVASAASFADGYAGPVAFPESTDAPSVEQRLQRESRILARVRDDLGRSVAGALVEIDVTTKPEARRHQSLTSDSRGQAEFARLPAGSLSMSASHVGYVPADPIVVGLAADQRRTVDLLLARCGSLDVVVKDGRGETLAGIEISAALTDGDPRGESIRHTKTNIRGGARLTGLRPGRWEVSGDATNRVTVEIEAGELATIELVGQR